MFGKDEQFNKEMETIIGPSVNVEGNFVAAGDIIVEGSISGTLKTDGHLKVGERAKIMADVSAGTALISGEIHGNIKVKDMLELTATAKIFGDLKTKTISVAPGAIISGKCSAGDENAIKVEKTDKTMKDKILKSRDWKIADEGLKLKV